MLITRKDEIKNPVENPTGEKIYEMIGNPEELGNAKKHSFGYVVIPPTCSSELHYHEESEETYYILEGKGEMKIDENKYRIDPGDAILISPPEKHQLFNTGEEDLEFLVVCAPPWKKSDCFFIEE